MKLAILSTHPIQYTSPVFRELVSHKDLSVKVFFGCNQGVLPLEDPTFKVLFKWDCEPTKGFDHVFMSSGTTDQLYKISSMRLALKAVQMISDYKPDAVLIFGYFPFFILAASILLRINSHFPLLFRGETTDVALDRSLIKDIIRKFFLSYHYKGFKHFFPIGSNSVDHFLRMGVSADKLSTKQYSIDVDFFQQYVDKWLPQREQLRGSMGIQAGDHVFIYCGKMFAPKDPLIIPKAIQLLPDEQKSRTWLLAVGDGELRYEFESLSKQQLGKKAMFVGFKNQSELGEYYALADTLILPSTSGETWGLVVNEALQFKLKAIVSGIVGSGRDLIADRDRGWIFASGDAQDLTKALTLAIDSPNLSENTSNNLPHPKQFADAIYSNLLKLTHGKTQLL